MRQAFEVAWANACVYRLVIFHFCITNLYKMTKDITFPTYNNLVPMESLLHEKYVALHRENIFKLDIYHIIVTDEI